MKKAHDTSANNGKKFTVEITPTGQANCVDIEVLFDQLTSSVSKEQNHVSEPDPSQLRNLFDAKALASFSDVVFIRFDFSTYNFYASIEELTLVVTLPGHDCQVSRQYREAGNRLRWAIKQSELEIDQDILLADILDRIRRYWYSQEHQKQVVVNIKNLEGYEKAIEAVVLKAIGEYIDAMLVDERCFIAYSHDDERIDCCIPTASTSVNSDGSRLIVFSIRHATLPSNVSKLRYKKQSVRLNWLINLGTSPYICSETATHAFTKALYTKDSDISFSESNLLILRKLFFDAFLYEIRHRQLPMLELSSAVESAVLRLTNSLVKEPS